MSAYDWNKLKWKQTSEEEPPTHARLAVRSGACMAVREVKSFRSITGVWFRVWWNPFENTPEPGVSQWMEWARMPENVVLTQDSPRKAIQFTPPKKNIFTWQGRRKFQVKVGSGTSKTVWVKGAVTEGATVDFKIVGDPKWRRGVAYDVTWHKGSPFKLTMGGAPPGK